MLPQLFKNVALVTIDSDAVALATLSKMSLVFIEK